MSLRSRSLSALLALSFLGVLSVACSSTREEPSTCASLGAGCGFQPDGNGNILDCGACVAGETCGAAGPNQCGVGECFPATCESLGLTCAQASDNCGQIIECTCDGGVPGDGGPGTDAGTDGADGGTDGTDGGNGTVDPTTVLPRNGLAFGSAAAGVSTSDAASAYNIFKTHHFQNCGSQIAVINPDAQPRGGNVVSEGIAYGMLLAVSHSDKATFDGLGAYYQAHLNSNNLMGWLVSGCNSGNVDNTAAIDADIDVAMAYIMAECKWGDATYGPLALKALNAINNLALIRSGGVYYVKPGDNWGGTSVLNPSYFSPAYFRAFALYQPANADRWNGAANDSYTVLNRGKNASTGFVPDWMDSNGQCVDGQSCNYAWESVRYPWRIATDYFWWGTPAAQTMLTPMANWAKSQQAHTIGDVHGLSGNMINNYGKAGVIGSVAIGTAAVDPSGSGFLFNELKGRMETAPDWYYSNALRALFLTSAAGMFSACPMP